MDNQEYILCSRCLISKEKGCRFIRPLKQDDGSFVYVCQRSEKSYFLNKDFDVTDTILEVIKSRGLYVEFQEQIEGEKESV